MSGPFGSHQWMYASGGFYGFDIESSLRFNDDDSAFLTFTPASAGNRKTFTWSSWIKRSELDADFYMLFTAEENSTNKTQIYFDDNHRFNLYGGGPSAMHLITTQVFRDPSAWYHIVVEVDTTQGTASDRVNIYVNGSKVTAFSTETYPNQNIDTFMGAAFIHAIGVRATQSDFPFDGYLAEVNFIDGTALDQTSFGETKEGIWIPKDTSGLTFGTNGFRLQFKDDAEVQGFNTVLYEGEGAVQQVTGVGFSPDLVWVKTRTDTNNHNLFDTVRGPSRRVFSNLTNAENTTANTFQSFDSDGFTTGVIADVNDNNEDHVAWCWDAGANNASTGHSSVTWTGNGGTQAISGLPFRPDLVWIKSRTQDEAQNHNLYDTVRGANVRLRSNTTSAEATDDNALMSFDKNGFILGDDSHHNQSDETYVGWAWDAGDSDPASNTNGSITTTVKSNGDFAVISYTGNGTASATLGHSLSAAPDFVIVKNRSTDSTNWNIWGNGTNFTRFGQFGTQSERTDTQYHPTMGSTTITLPSTNDGAWNTSSDNYIMYAWRNVTGKQQFGKYTGNASSTGPTVSLGFRPGLVMIKALDRDNSVWYVFDTSRQPFNDPTNYTHKYLKWNSTDAEYTNADDGKIEITSTGFQVRASVTGMNASGEEYIYAAWAGSYSDFITDVNTTGSITSRVKANATYGFSVVSYVGSGANATVGHGLGATPDWIIVKNRDRSSNWHVWHNALAGTEFLELSSSAAKGTDAPSWNSTVPTSTVFSVGTSNSTNASGEDLIAYIWSAVSGYSSFGSYTGNGSSTGPTVTTGFKPAFVILKPSSAVDHWNMYDNTRDTSNPTNALLFPNRSNAEGNAQDIEITDTGFQLKNNNTGSNGNGTTYIYAAFADTRDAAFWLDSSGNNNDFQHINLDHNDTVSDSPTDNFATFNPLQVATSGAPTFADGNLEVTTPVSGSGIALSTIGVTSGKYFAEVTIVSINSLQRSIVGITGDADATITANTNIGSLTSSLDVGYFYNGTKFVGNVETSGYGDSYDVGDVIGIALNVDDSEVTFFKNGATQGAISFTAGGTYHFAYCDGSAGAGGTARVNFGQQPFVYGPPE